MSCPLTPPPRPLRSSRCWSPTACSSEPWWAGRPCTSCAAPSSSPRLRGRGGSPPVSPPTPPSQIWATCWARPASTCSLWWETSADSVERFSHHLFLNSREQVYTTNVAKPPLTPVETAAGCTILICCLCLTCFFLFLTVGLNLLLKSTHVSHLMTHMAANPKKEKSRQRAAEVNNILQWTHTRTKS